MKLFVLPLALGLGYVAPAPKAVIKLLSYFSCQASLLTPDGNAALACYAPTQRGCQQGVVVLAYEKRAAYLGGGASFAIVDTLRLTLRYPNNDLSISSCAAGAGPARQYFVLCKQAALGQKYLCNLPCAYGA